jgi:cysteinyl-tRNA synthetase
MDSVLSVLDYSILENDEIPKEILEKLEQRNEAKKTKNFDLSDKIRDEISLL